MTKYDTFTVGTTTEFATTLGLPRQQRQIANHLLAGKNITQLKADHVYKVTNLPDVIMKLRRRGYDIKTTVLFDESGSKYASYTLVKPEAVAA